MKKTLLYLFLLGSTLFTAAFAQEPVYPAKPVKIMVGASPGGGTDILARMLADKFGLAMKQTFLVENKPGAANTLAADMTAKASPDGYTLLLATNTAQAIAPHLLKLGYDPLKDLQALGLVVTVPQVLVVAATHPARDTKEFIAAMKANPASYNYGSSGIGSTQHIAGVALNIASGTTATHVPYKGSSAAHIDLISGQLQFMIDTTSSAMSQIKAGKLKALAITTPTRSAQLPDVPTMAESDFASVSVTTWYGLYTTNGTPLAILNKLHDELQGVLKLPDVQERLLGLGGEAGNLTRAQFASLNQAEYQRYGEVIKSANIRAE
jgi:tripartite-type tricarboxylate transporter receptor subunit TctC